MKELLPEFPVKVLVEEKLKKTLKEKGETFVTNIPTRINKIIDEFVQVVNEILGSRVKKIILYASYARGDFNKSSDIDIMILTDLSDDEIFEYRVKVWDYAYDIEYNNNFEITLSPYLYTF